MKKIARKSIAAVAMFVGLAAASALDSDISVWGTIGLIAVFIIGFFGGAALFCKGEGVPQID